MTAARLFALSCVALLGGCYLGPSDAESGTDTDADGTAASTGGPTSTATMTAAGSQGTTTADDASADSSESSDASPTTGLTDATEGTEGTDSTESDTSTKPGAPQIPDVQGECPEFVVGVGDNPSSLSFPVGSGSRQALVWHDPGQGGGGPLVFYFHGGGGDPDDAIPSVSSDAIASIVESGGMVVAPYPDPAAATQWFLVSGGAENDMVMMDSMVACAVQDADIDPYRIHGIGFSAGALHVAMSSIFRSSYMASTVTYSGGVYSSAASQDPNSTPSALILHGGNGDNVGGVAFGATSQDYFEVITERGGEAVICEHDNGHNYPQNETDVWRRRDAYNFLVDHPFGVDPHPYDAGLPEWVPPYCNG